MTITTAGTVGIGTTAPGSALHISGAMGTNTSTYDSASAIKLTNTGGISWLLTSGIIGVIHASFCIRRESVALPALTIQNSTDNVGIGTNSPTSKLDVVGAVTASTYIKVTPVAVSALPAAATAGAGARAFVNDALTPVFGSAVTGGGAVAVPVYSTGSAWNVG
jgi:hypothetical protein